MHADPGWRGPPATPALPPPPIPPVLLQYIPTRPVPPAHSRMVTPQRSRFTKSSRSSARPSTSSSAFSGPPKADQARWSGLIGNSSCTGWVKSRRRISVVKISELSLFCHPASFIKEFVFAAGNKASNSWSGRCPFHYPHPSPGQTGDDNGPGTASAASPGGYAPPLRPR